LIGQKINAHHCIETIAGISKGKLLDKIGLKGRVTAEPCSFDEGAGGGSGNRYGRRGDIEGL